MSFSEAQIDNPKCQTKFWKRFDHCFMCPTIRVLDIYVYIYNILFILQLIIFLIDLGHAGTWFPGVKS